MSQIRLHYFETRGRAEGIRKLLHYKKVPFEDIRIPKDQWEEKKKNFKYGQVPALEVDGKFLYQSNTIIRYLARKFDLEGKDPWEVAQIDELHELLTEYHNSIKDYVYVLLGLAQGDKDKLRQEKLIPGIQKYMPHFERALKEAGSGFYTPSGLTFFDLVIAEGESRLVEAEPDLIKDFPLVVQHGKRVHELPELQEYLANRK